MEYNNTSTPNTELAFKDIINILGQYKWLIIIMTILFAIFSYIYLYYKSPVYNSYSIVKIKTPVKSKPEDVISSITTTNNSKDVSVTEEVNLLKTFRINRNALKVVNYQVQYYIDKEYREVELYNDLPIIINNIIIHDKKIIGKRLTLYPEANGFSIKYEEPFKNKIQHHLFGKELFKFNNKSNHTYNSKVSNEYFSMKVTKNVEINQPIHFILRGDNREIFEYIVKNKLDVSQVEKDTSLIKITFNDTIADRAELYVQALTESFINYSIQSKNEQNNKVLKIINEQLEANEKVLSDAKEKKKIYQLKKGILKPSEQALLYIQKLSALEIKLSENQLRMRVIEDLQRHIQSSDGLDTIAPSLTQIGANNSLRLVMKLQDNQLIKEELSNEYTSEHPKIQIIEKQNRNIKNKIKYNLKVLHANVKHQRDMLFERKNSYSTKLRTLPEEEKDLIQINSTYELAAKMEKHLLTKKANNHIAQRATFSDYTIIDDAYKSKIPLKTKRLLIIVANIILGFILGTILALIHYYKTGKIKRKEDISNLTTLPIYGTIPFFKQKKHELEVNRETKSPFTESFRTLRSNLQFLNPDNDSQTILITSTIQAEGKSTTAANLAVILEIARYKTIVVNLDLRKPSLHKFFSIPNDKGVSTYLNGNHNIDDIVSSTEFSHLDIIPSGPIPIDPAELILSKRLPLLIEELKKRYEYVIIDSAPMGIVIDTKTIMKYTDINLVIIRENYAHKKFISTLEDIVQKYNFNHIGLILNASKDSGGEYGYGYSYEYGDS